MKLSKIIFIPCAVLIVSSASVIAQGYLLDKGQSGFGTQIGYAQGPESNILQGTFVGTVSGMVDIGFFFRSTSIDRSSSMNSVGIIYEFYPLRADTTGSPPLNISIFFQYGSSGTENPSSLGFYVFKKVSASENSFMQPYLSLAKSWPFGVDKPGEYIIEFGFTFAGKKGNSKIFSMTPSIAKSKDDIFIGLSAGFTFPLQFQDQKKDEWEF